MTLAKITLKNGKADYDGKEVELTLIQYCILRDKGEGGHVLIRKEHLKLKQKNDRENNKQDPARSISS